MYLRIAQRSRRMGRKRHTSEQIIRKLRTSEIELAKGLGTAGVVRKLGITEPESGQIAREFRALATRLLGWVLRNAA
jgi:hypothetical protein